MRGLRKNVDAQPYRKLGHVEEPIPRASASNFEIDAGSETIHADLSERPEGSLREISDEVQVGFELNGSNDAATISKFQKRHVSTAHSA